MIKTRPQQLEFVRALLPKPVAETPSSEPPVTETPVTGTTVPQRHEQFVKVVRGMLVQMGGDNREERECAQRAIALFGEAVVHLLLTAVCKLEEFGFDHLRGEGSALTRINAAQALIHIAGTAKDPRVLAGLDAEIVQAIATARKVQDARLNRELARLIGFRRELVAFPEVTEFLEFVREERDEEARNLAAGSLGTLWTDYAASLQPE